MLTRRRRGAALLMTVTLVPLLGVSCPQFIGVVAVSETLDAEILAALATPSSTLAPLSDGRVLFAERLTGRIRVIKDGVLLPTPFADVPVNAAGERGLLGLAVDPDFADTGRIYAFYTRSSTPADTTDAGQILDQRVVYFTAAGDVATGGETLIASFAAGSTGARVGGRLGFASSGELYVLLGDGGDPATAQDAASALGKVHRFNADGSIPVGNPDPANSVVASGLRDPRGLAFDALSSEIYVAERGALGQSELNRVFLGANFGWPEVIGVADTPTEQAFAAATPGYREPMLASNPLANRPFVGLTRNPSTRYGPGAVDALFCGVTSSGRLIQFELTADRTGVAAESGFAAGFAGTLTDVAFTPAGTLYVATTVRIYRLVPRP